MLLTSAFLGLGSGQSASAAPRQAAPPDLTVVSWNICGEAGGGRGAAGYCPYRNEPERKTEELARLVVAENADAVVLQETCGGPDGAHEKSLREKLGAGWSFAFAPVKRPDDKNADGTPQGDPEASACRGSLAGGILGNLIAVRGTITAEAHENALPADPTGVSVQRLPIQCVAVAEWSTSVCDTHIIPGASDPRVPAQIQAVRAFVAGFGSAHGTARTVLGGDFNRAAADATMKPLTSAYENCVSGATHHGWDNAAKAHRRHEFDHLFVSRPAEGSAFSSCSVESALMDTTENESDSGDPNGFSDHAPVVGRLGGHRTAGDLNGDGLPDLLAVDDSGRLRLYPGDGHGGLLGAPAVIGTGGWLDASVTHRGDWTGDGLEDVVARVGDELRVYPGRVGGTLGSPVRLRTGLASDARLVAIGDATGDGRTDLVVSTGGKLWLYESDWTHRPAVREPRLIGTGGWSPMTLTAPGDADHDGRPDLLARDTRDGTLWLYRGLAGGGVGARTEYGHGWTTAARPLLAGAADADRDGRADLWATTSEGTGTLLFYSGGTSASGEPTDGPRTTVGLRSWNTIRALS
ncbi:FG-GAP-like repeat-containing protein [Streptomyces sp. NPDC002248]